MTQPPLPEVDVGLLQYGGPWTGPSTPAYTDPQFGIPNDQGQPEVDTALLPGVPGQRGPTGPTGPAGAPGHDGAPGVSGGFFQFTPADARTTWNIGHNLGYKPSVRVLDSFGTEYFGQITYTDNNNVVLTFSTAVFATAYLS